MTRNRNSENPVRSATFRKWYARAWWVSVHVYGYVVLGVMGALSPTAQPITQFVLYLAVAVTTISCYILLQCSSPGQLEKRPLLAPVHTASPTDIASPSQTLMEDDTELLSDRTENEQLSNSVNLHFCNECHVFQPLRTKHCKDCARCTRQYDHQCVRFYLTHFAAKKMTKNLKSCETNRRLFVFYLFLQILECAVMIQVTSSAISEGKDFNDWLKINALYIILWFMILSVLLIVVTLFCYQAYLISTNQTSWEHARRSSITYLQNLPDRRSPFDRGIVQNWWVFITNGDSNKWVHQSVAKPMTSHHDDASSLV